MSILEKIQMLCEEHKTTVPALERELSLGNGAIYKWQKSSPKVDTLHKVAQYFGVTVDSLLADKIIIDDINNIDDEIKKVLTDPTSKPYILISAKAREKGMSPETLEKLIELYAK